MKRHELLIDTSLSPTCRKCQEDVESSFHAYEECPALAWHCIVVTGELFLQQPLNWSVKHNFGSLLNHLLSACWTKVTGKNKLFADQSEGTRVLQRIGHGSAWCIFQCQEFPTPTNKHTNMYCTFIIRR